MWKGVNKSVRHLSRKRTLSMFPKKNSGPGTNERVKNRNNPGGGIIFEKLSHFVPNSSITAWMCRLCEAQVNSSASLPGQPTMKNPSHPIQKCVVTQLPEIVSTFLFTTRFFFSIWDDNKFMSSLLGFHVANLQFPHSTKWHHLFAHILLGRVAMQLLRKKALLLIEYHEDHSTWRNH